LLPDEAQCQQDGDDDPEEEKYPGCIGHSMTPLPLGAFVCAVDQRESLQKEYGEDTWHQIQDDATCECENNGEEESGLAG
jgi:hypothetical protein